MKHYTLTIHRGKDVFTLPADGKTSLLKTLRSAGIPLQADCGGNGRCGKCSVDVRGLLRPVNGTDAAEVTASVPACRYAPAGNCELWTEHPTAKIDPSEEVILPRGGDGLGLAIDLGTTTVSAALYDLKSGRRLDERHAFNAQRSFGADVVSRMEYCRKHGAELLLRCTEQQLRELTEPFGTVQKAVIVGNTVMEHLAAGLDIAAMAVPPFTPAALFGTHGKSPALEQTDVYYGRCVSAYVGGDVTAGLLAAGLSEPEGLTLYIDIGTNGELALLSSDGCLTCATAAGPAFEGAEIACGICAGDGAIDAVWQENGDIRCRVSGGGTAKGICGSGLIDAVAVLLELGLIEKSGRLTQAEHAPEKLRQRFIRCGGTRAFLLADEVYLTAHDIRKVQLAKAAIRAGAETLLQGRQPSAILIAGGFGSHIRVESARRIGLLPDAPAEVRVLGNAAARGAAMLLLPENEARLHAIAEMCRYTELSSSAEFSRRYLSCLSFD